MGRRASGIEIVSQDFKRDPISAFQSWRHQGAVVRGRVPLLGEAWLVLSHAEVSAVLKDSERFVVDARNAGRGRFDAFKLPIPGTLRALADNMLGRDDPDHRRLRNLVERGFRRSRVEDLEGPIHRLAEGLLEPLVLQAARSPVDLVAGLARPLPMAVICELLGLPEADRPRFSRWFGATSNIASGLGLFRALPGLVRMSRYLRAQFEERRRDPGPGLISALVEEEAGDRLSESELLAMVFLLLGAGFETTTHLISTGVYELLRDPEARTGIGPSSEDWAPAVEELLRFTSPVQMTKPRYAVEPVTLGGASIERGDVVFPVLAAANADPEVFTAPERFDPGRSPNPHLAFGSGVHSCLGLQLARAEARASFSQLFGALPKLRLAEPASTLRWTPRLGMRGLVRLPVTAA